MHKDIVDKKIYGVMIKSMEAIIKQYLLRARENLPFDPAEADKFIVDALVAIERFGKKRKESEKNDKFKK